MARSGSTQLGVSARHPSITYDKLFNAQLIVSSRSTGPTLPITASRPRRSKLPAEPGSFLDMYQASIRATPFSSLGIPHDAFSSKAHCPYSITASHPSGSDRTNHLSHTRGAGASARSPHLAIARGIDCSPSQIIITSGFAGGLGLALRALGLEADGPGMEDPGFPGTRRGLEIAKLALAPIP